MNKFIPYGEVIITEETQRVCDLGTNRMWVEAALSLDYIRMLPKILRWTGLDRLRRYLEVDALEYSK